MKKLIAIAMILAMILSCSAMAEATYTVGICQLVQHVALDAATKGFRDAIDEALPGQVTFDEQNASNDSAICATIVNSLLAEGVDLIMANATPALVAAATATEEVPVLATSITDFASALELTEWTGTIGTNVSGTCDLAPLDQQAAMVKEFVPDAKVVGVLYCSAEANSKYQADTIKGYLTEMGYEVQMFTFADSNDVASVAQVACEASDVLYIPTDNTAASCTETIAGVVLSDEYKTPVIAGEKGICEGCGIATLSIDYYDLGYTTGKMAVKVLTGEANISEMPIEYAPEVTKLYNAANCELLGIAVPEGYTAIEG